MRFPAWPRKLKTSSTSLQRPSLFLLAGAGLLLLGMLAGIYLFFPAEALRQRIIQEVGTRTGMEVQIGQVALYPLLTLDADRIKLGVTGLTQPLEIEQLSVAPQWSTLLSGDPGVQLQGRVMLGTITAGLQKGGAISARANGLRFELPMQKPIPFSIMGTLSEASLNSSTRLGPDTKTGLSLRLADVSILGLEILRADSPGLSLGEITLDLDGQGRALRISAINAKGGDLEVDGNGTLQIGRTAATSRIRLVLQVRPGPNADPNISSLLQLAGEPGPDGRYPLQLIGTLAKPILKPGG
ncbi:MAG: type II secretion system protein GspN [Desulfuromonadales bacterium]